MAKKFLFRGRTEEELTKLSINEFADLIDSRARRKIKRGFTESEKKLLTSIEKGESNIKTHCRDMIILPNMIGQTIKVHTGKEWASITLIPEMAGHRLGEFALSRKVVKHGSAGIGATRSSSSASVR